MASHGISRKQAVNSSLELADEIAIT